MYNYRWEVFYRFNMDYPFISFKALSSVFIFIFLMYMKLSTFFLLPFLWTYIWGEAAIFRCSSMDSTWERIPMIREVNLLVISVSLSTVFSEGVMVFSRWDCVCLYDLHLILGLKLTFGVRDFRAYCWAIFFWNLWARRSLIFYGSMESYWFLSLFSVLILL